MIQSGYDITFPKNRREDIQKTIWTRLFMTPHRRYFKRSLLSPSFFEAIGTMPATAATTIAPGDEIEFGKYPIVIFFIEMNTFDQVSAPARKRVLFFLRDKLVKFLQTIRTQAIEKCVREKGFGFVT